jgi:glycosyltransferase involved in cell wall biosynthesis
LRTLVYTDYTYQRIDGRIFSERAFSLFLAAVAGELDGDVVLLGRVRPDAEDAHYGIGDGVEFMPLPWYRSLVAPAAIPAILRSLGTGWRAVGMADRVWLLGPHPLIAILALFAIVRRRRLVLGVRQDFPTYIAARRPRSRVLRFVANLLERSFRALGRRCPVVVVGPELARNYRRSRELLEIPVSLIRADQIVSEREALARDYSGTRTILSVGRLDTEKNPLLLADVLARLLAQGGEWRLEVCGEGPLAGDLEAELRRLGIERHAELAGYVPFDGGLVERYRGAHVLLHSSLTEGLPQVLLEAFAAGLPVVASDVGGIAEAVGPAVSLIPAGDPAAAAAAVEAVATDSQRRAALIGAGLEYIGEHTIEIETARVARFLEG